MKKDALLFLFAGFILGSIATFVVMKGMEEAKPVPAASGQAADSTEMETAPAGMTPEQHSSILAEYMKQAKEDPKNLRSRLTLANIFFERGKFAEAKGWYVESLKLDPNNTDIIVDLGVCYRELKDPAKAMELFDEALKVDPKKQQALYNKVVVALFDLEDMEAAKKHLADFEKAYPDNPMAKQIKEQIEKAGAEK